MQESPLLQSTSSRHSAWQSPCRHTWELGQSLLRMQSSSLLQAPSPLEGNAYDQLPASLPRYWPDALARFESSKFIGDNFGKGFQRAYALTKTQELDEFDKQVTALEYDACL